MKELSAKSGLNQNIINQINNIFAKYPQIKKVMLYGSRAKGNYKKGSDIDLSMFGKDLTYKIQLDVFDDLDELLLPYKIDLSVFDYLDNANLRDHIERVGVVFYEREISRLPKGWEMKKLGEVCYSKSSNVSQNQLADEVGEYPIFGASGLIKNVSFYHRDKPYLSIVKDGSGFGRITKMDAFTSVIGTLQYILPNDDIDLDYLNYSLMSVDFKKYVQGAAIPHIYFKDYKNEPFLWMPLPEQKRIVAILDEAFLAINKAKANAEANLKNAKELFESYLRGVFENNGEGWEERKLGEICDYDKISNKRNDLPYVGLEDIQSNTGIFIGPFEPRSMKSLTFYFNNEHVLYGRLRPYLNKVLLPDFEGHCSTEIFPIKPKKNILDRGFLFQWLITAETMKKINATWTGATLPRANMNTVLEFKINLPPLKEQQKIVQKFDSLSTETKKLEAIYQAKINDLEELKKSVLQKAFAGQLIMDN